MNERIKELAEQAGLKVESWMTIPPKPFQILGSTEQFEKFAELMVWECTAIMHKDTSPNCPYVDYFKVTNEIKQHFGVEE